MNANEPHEYNDYETSSDFDFAVSLWFGTDRITNKHWEREAQGCWDKTTDDLVPHFSSRFIESRDKLALKLQASYPMLFSIKWYDIADRLIEAVDQGLKIKSTATSDNEGE